MPAHHPRGVLITLEGGEGTGKSTRSKQLAERLRATGLTVVQTREPGGTEVAEQIRAILLDNRYRPDPLTEVALFMAARRSHWQAVIQPALEAGNWVVCDRFQDSTLAYQGHARGLGEAFIEQGYHWLMGGFRPDVTLMLDMQPEAALARARVAKREFTAGDRFEQEELAFHQRLRQGFLTIAAREPSRCAVIPAEGSVEEVQARLWQALQARVRIPHGAA